MSKYEECEFDFAKRHMVSDEYILWKGKPEKGKLFSISDIYTIPISIMLFIVGVGGVIEKIEETKGFSFYYVFATFYIGVLLYILFGKYIHISLIRKHSYYVITNKKIIRKKMGKIDTLSLKNLPAIDARIYKNGNGTISFGRVGYYKRQRTITIPENNDIFAIENIADAAKVQDIISTASENYY